MVRGYRDPPIGFKIDQGLADIALISRQLNAYLPANTEFDGSTTRLEDASSYHSAADNGTPSNVIRCINRRWP